MKVGERDQFYREWLISARDRQIEKGVTKQSQLEV